MQFVSKDDEMYLFLPDPKTCILPRTFGARKVLRMLNGIVKSDDARNNNNKLEKLFHVQFNY